MCQEKETEKCVMSGANLQHLLAMILYMAAVVGIGIYFAGRANKDAESAGAALARGSRRSARRRPICPAIC